MEPGEYLYKVAAVNAAGVSAMDQIDAAVWAPGYLVAFDGTWEWPGRMHKHDKNDPNEQPYNRQTSILHFSQKYQQEGKYFRGVGNLQDHPTGLLVADEGDLFQGAFGFEAISKVIAQYNNLIDFYQTEDHRKHVPLDLIGYSRGAYQAMKLAEWVGKFGIPNNSAGGTPFQDKIAIRFMGLVSPVGQMGAEPVLHKLTLGWLPPLNLGWPTVVPKNVKHFLQIVVDAAHATNSDNVQTTMTIPNLDPAPGISYETHVYNDESHGDLGEDPKALREMIHTARVYNVPVAKYI